MEIRYSKQAVKAIHGMDKPTKDRIKQGIEGIPEGDIKPLQGYSDGRRRLRIGKYRVLFQIYMDNDNEILYIMDVGSRGGIYK